MFHSVDGHSIASQNVLSENNKYKLRKDWVTVLHMRYACVFLKNGVLKDAVYSETAIGGFLECWVSLYGSGNWAKINWV